jgi:serine phosphatase RsbU (regulator of sigma subunit)
MQTATEVGGDYYDFHVHEDGTLTVILGDATGHGMQSGMMVSIMKSLFMSDRSNKDLVPFFNNCNASLKDMHLGRLMMALTCAQFNGKSVNISNAGMPPILVYNSVQNKVEEILVEGMPLGAIGNQNYETKTIQISKGDSILLLSDGLLELQNENQEFFGYQKVKSIFLKYSDRSAEEIISHLKDAGLKWINHKETKDDVSMIIVKYLDGLGKHE